jgi:hypothetical protein
LEPEAVTIQEAAKILGLPSRTELYRVLQAGGVLKEVQQGGKRLIVREGLEEAWENRPRRRIQAPTSEAGRAGAKARQESAARRPRAAKQPSPGDWPAPPGENGPGLPKIPHGMPSLEEERAWLEFEKRYEKRRENMKEDGLLIYKTDAKQAIGAVLAELLNRAHGCARQVRLQLPHITGEDVVVIERVFLAIFDEVSKLDFEDLGQ